MPRMAQGSMSNPGEGSSNHPNTRGQELRREVEWYAGELGDAQRHIAIQDAELHVKNQKLIEVEQHMAAQDAALDERDQWMYDANLRITAQDNEIEYLRSELGRLVSGTPTSQPSNMNESQSRAL